VGAAKPLPPATRAGAQRTRVTDKAYGRPQGSDELTGSRACVIGCTGLPVIAVALPCGRPIGVLGFKAMPRISAAERGNPERLL
jgi:hypothetical protein